MGGRVQQGGLNTTEQSTQLLQEYVYRALVSKSSGTDVAAYNSFVKEFAVLRKQVERDSNEAGLLMLSNFVNALKGCVSLLKEPHHNTILTEVLSIKLWDTSPVVRASVLDFLSTLVIVNTAFTHTCLRLLVSCLTPPPSPPSPEANTGPWAPTEEQLMVQAAITGTLIKVMELVPTATVSLMDLVRSHFPHKLHDRNTQCLYFSAVFVLAESGVGRPLRDLLLAALVAHILQLDVEIRWEDIVDVPNDEAEEEEACDAEEDVEDIFQLEGMSELDLNASPEELARLREERAALAAGPRGGWEGAAGQGTAAAATTAQPAPTTVDETANKLDCLMELLFSHLERRCALAEAGAAGQTWSALLACFEHTILHAHRSKFSQFLVFYLCSKYPDPCVKTFVDFLLVRLHDATLPPITRSACAAYLASFLARCAAVPPALVLHALDAITRFAEQYCAGQQQQQQSSAAGQQASDTSCLTTKHQVLYAAIQAILYVLCYQLSSLLHHQHHHHHKQPLSEAVRTLVKSRLLPLLSHPLQPLQVCLPSVVAEFRAQLVTHGIGSIPHPAAASTDAAAARKAQRPLEMFFPFDPYLLKRSSRFLDLRLSYIRWRKGGARVAGRLVGAGSESDDDSESSEEEEEEEEEEGAGQGNRPKAGDGVDDEDDLELDASSDGDDDDSSSDTDDESLRCGSMLSDHMMLAPPKLQPGKRGLTQPGQIPARGLHHAWGGRGGPHMLPVGSKRAPSPGTLMGTSYDPMATSYGTAAMSTMGDLTPTGTSPVLVEYHGDPLGRSASPMQMTPQYHHMDAVPSRLNARR